MNRELNINEVRLIMAEFNKKHCFKLIETKTPPKIETVFSSPFWVKIYIDDIAGTSYRSKISWKSTSSMKMIQFIVISERSKNPNMSLLNEKRQYRHQIRLKLQETTSLYLAV